MNDLRRICVFCGSSPGALDAYAAAARELGQTLAQQQIGLVYGGGQIGLMGVVADAVLAHGGQVTGIIPRTLATRELAHAGLQELRVVESMHERKAQMADLADAFIALPGGYGTFEEFLEVLTWAQLGLHKKPCAVLNVQKFFDPLLTLIDHAVAEQFVTPLHRSLLLSANTVPETLRVLREYQAPDIKQWIERDKT